MSACVEVCVLHLEEPTWVTCYRKARYNDEPTIKADRHRLFVRDESVWGIDLSRIAQQEVDKAHRRKTRETGYANVLSNNVQSASSLSASSTARKR